MYVILKQCTTCQYDLSQCCEEENIGAIMPDLQETNYKTCIQAEAVSNL